MAAEYTHGNAASLRQLREDPNIEIRPFPAEVIALLRSITKEVVDELMVADPAAAKIGKAYFDYLAMVSENSRIAEQAYLDTREY
jgi:TRAP-type mannitol/chloroaromatic compound transport system substrate-binding protein